jgi:tRNA U34 5-methylaminomethyl-2-thiouridine-forming methyltransferase MnmC
MSDDYQLVRLPNGKPTLFSARFGEKMHPGLGPQAEAEVLYVEQLQICERLRASNESFVIWDVGLGAAANATAALRAAREIIGQLRLISFDDSSAPLEFALNQAAALDYLAGYEVPLTELLRHRLVSFIDGKLTVNWEFHFGDFPALMQAVRRGEVKMEAPHAVFYDAFSPAKNPAMWTLPIFEDLFQSLDPQRPCSLTTYSRSTLVRATLLLAGFWVGTGPATGLKEETTIAANRPELITQLLDQRWLLRAERSDSAEPLRDPVYTRAPLSASTLNQLRALRQFASA